MLSQPNMVSPLVRPPHANTFPGGVQRTPMGPPMSPNLSGGLMPHPRPQHPPRGPSGLPLAPRGTQAALKAEQDLKVMQIDSWYKDSGFPIRRNICSVRVICSWMHTAFLPTRLNKEQRYYSPHTSSSLSSSSRWSLPSLLVWMEQASPLTVLLQTTRGLHQSARSLTNPHPLLRPSLSAQVPSSPRPSNQKRANKSASPPNRPDTWVDAVIWWR